MNYEEYYKRLRVKNEERKLEFFDNHVFTPSKTYDSGKKSIFSEIYLKFIISTSNSKNYGEENGLVVELNILDKNFFEETEIYQNYISSALGIKTVRWQSTDTRNRIYVKKIVDIEDENKWDEYINWHIETMIKFMNVFPSFINKLKKGELLESTDTPSLVIPYPDEVSEDLYEGAQKKVIVNIHERNPVARKECLLEHGYSCSVCSLNFEDKYGDIGKNFIHVHHLTPISDIKEEYQIDAINDLRPVCPNCHAMLHKKKPPYSIDELRKIINIDL